MKYINPSLPNKLFILKVKITIFKMYQSLKNEFQFYKTYITI